MCENNIGKQDNSESVTMKLFQEHGLPSFTLISLQMYKCNIFKTFLYGKWNNPQYGIFPCSTDSSDDIPVKRDESKVGFIYIFLLCTMFLFGYMISYFV